MQTGLRYGKTQLIGEVYLLLQQKGRHASVRDVAMIVNLIFNCMQDGLIKNGNLTINELGSLSITPNRRKKSGLRVSYRMTSEIKKALDDLWETV